jgi:hypothetical protein
MVEYLQQVNSFSCFMLREFPLASPAEQVYDHEKPETADNAP